MSPVARQTTIARPIRTEGVGLHSGEPCLLTLSPSEADTGLVFQSASGERVPATVDSVVDTRRCTTLGSANSHISTVEHLLSALAGLGVDNAAISLAGPEVPAGDGSAREWVQAIRCAGVTTLEAPRRELRLMAPVWVEEGASWGMAVPGPRFTLSVAIDFDAPIGRQAWSQALTPARYARELAPARTFCFQHEVEALLAAGLAKGGTTDNAVVASPEGYSVPLRFPDEPVRHKAMDAVGDLALCGGSVCAHVVLVRPSHHLNVALARALRDHSLGGRVR